MKSYYNADTNCNIQMYLANEVTLPDDSDKVETVHYAKNNLLCIKRKSVYSEKIKVCCDTDTLINELTKTSSKKHCNNSDNQNSNEKKCSDNSENTVAKKIKVKDNKNNCNKKHISENVISNEKNIFRETGEERDNSR